MVSLSEDTKSTMAQPGTHLSTVSDTPVVTKKQWKQKSIACFSEVGAGGGFGEAACCAEQSREQEGKETEIMNKAEIVNSSLSKLQDTQKYYSHQPGELIIGWLLQCCASGANTQELESKEAQQLGSLTREWGINKRIGKGAKIGSLWR